MAAHFGALHIKTGDCIRALMPDVPNERRAMQEAGEELDRTTGAKWVMDGLTKHLGGAPDEDPHLVVVLDSVRIRGQIEAIRRGYGNRVIHIHLEASEAELAKRYSERDSGDFQELPSYAEVLQNETERDVAHLANIADVVISSERCSRKDVLLRVAGHAGLYGRFYDRRVDVLVGGQYGSEGKGQVAAYLAPEYDVLVRVGGPNAGHKVWRDPKPYTFHHIPSGTATNSTADIVLGAGTVINVQKLQKEIADWQIEADRLTIDPQVMVITEADIEEETSLRAKMGSTAQGVGAATSRRILDRHLARGACTIAANVPALRPYIRDAQSVLDEHYRRSSAILLEGTQGTGLSLYHGAYPFVTSRDTTVAGCLAEAGISPSRVRKVVMVCRTYPIRVANPPDGTSGPMSIELTWDQIAARSGLSHEELLKTEHTSTTNTLRRVSEFDWELLRRSASLNAPTDIALTFVDYITSQNRAASRIEQLSLDTLRFIEEVERVACAPVSLLSVRFHSRAIIDRRRW